MLIKASVVVFITCVNKGKCSCVLIKASVVVC